MMMKAMDEVGIILRGEIFPPTARILAAYGACALAIWGICGALVEKHFGHVLTIPLKVHILACSLLALQAMPLHVLPSTVFPAMFVLCTCGLFIHLTLTLWVNGHLGCSACSVAKEGEKVRLLDTCATLHDLEAADMSARGFGDVRSECSTAVGEGSEAESVSSERGSDDDIVAPEETAIIFDWDDTVLPSSWLLAQELSLDDDSMVTEWQRGQLAELASLAIETLRLAKTLGSVVFVTNADEGWIELSCKKFMPDLWPALRDVRLLSARTEYETPQNTTRPAEWKVRAFEAELVRIFGARTLACPWKRKNVMSIGDSIYEREALMRATRGLPNARSKSIKLADRPGIGELRAEHSIMAQGLAQMAQKDCDLDLCIRNTPCNP